MIKNKGTYWIYLSLLITTVLWVMSKRSLSSITVDPLISLNQISALLGTVLFAWTMILSTRLPILEDAFGGLDKVYHMHRKTGEYGFMFVLMHPFAIAFSFMDNFTSVFLPVHGKPPLTMGVISFWIFVYFVLATLFFRQLHIKYNIWKYTHLLLNVAMIVGFMHVLKVPSDTTRFAPLGLWIKGFMALGVMSGLYKTLLYRFVAPRYEYEITEISKNGDTYDLRLQSVDPKRKISYKSGQFAYVSFHSDAVSSEEHPFCIASSHREDGIRFVIKQLGDFTNNMDGLAVGDRATIYGPYGRISEKFYADPTKNAVFIAGGIGIAPFMAMFNCEETKNDKAGRKISLYYSTQYKKDAVFNDELNARVKSCDKLKYHNQCTREGDGHLKISTILAETDNPENTVFYLCANAKMMHELEKDLIAAGISKDRIVLEDFDMI